MCAFLLHPSPSARCCYAPPSEDLILNCGEKSARPGPCTLYKQQNSTSQRFILSPSFVATFNRQRLMKPSARVLFPWRPWRATKPTTFPPMQNMDDTFGPIHQCYTLKNTDEPFPRTKLREGAHFRHTFDNSTTGAYLPQSKCYRRTYLQHLRETLVSSPDRQ